MDQDQFSAVSQTLVSIYKAPNKLISDADVAKTLRETIKILFDGSVAIEPHGVKPLGPLEELIVENLDIESVWQELELRDKPLLKWARGTTPALIENHEAPLLTVELEEEQSDDYDNSEEEDDFDDEEEDDDDDADDDDEVVEEDEEEEEEVDASNDDEEYNELSDSDISKIKKGRSVSFGVQMEEEEREGDDDDDDDSSFKEGEEYDSDEPVPTDGFFKWNDMEKFADGFEKSQELEYEKMSRKSNRKKSKSKYGNNDESDSEEEEDDELDYFDEGGDDDSDDDIKYSDFFDAPNKVQSYAKRNSSIIKPHIKSKQDKLDDGDEDEYFDDLQGEDDEEDDDDAVEDAGKKLSLPQTSYERMKAKAQARIRELEEVAMQQKPWNLSGEVAGSKRPENSLLEIDAEWDTVRRAAPEVSAAQTLSLEEMIKQRILEERWDSVMPKRKEVSAKQTDLPELSQEKSDKGLAEIYEKDYLQKALGVAADDEYAPTREQARILFEKVCGKLNALSNFTYAPRAQVLEMQVTPSVGAIQMEEIIPLAVSNAQAQAPEEVHAKKRGRDSVVRSAEEMTHEERRAARAAKKKTRRKTRQQDEAEHKLAARVNPGLGNPYEKRKLIESLQGSKNVVTGDKVKLEENQKTHLSSAKFFEVLADEQSKGKKKKQKA